ncbi:MAG: hypothetical protein COA43_11010 [Robiginitomaculum sp.]|nr:MAG: hypothetical protein COA43_11010 [Robiginitomaculum sp.]
MARTTISFTEPNQEWLNAQIESQEFKSPSDVINSAVRQIRQNEEEMKLEKLIEARMKKHDATLQKLAQ